MIDLFALITFWSFVLAAYAIFPPVVRAKVKLFVSWQFTATVFLLTSLLEILATVSHFIACGNMGFCTLYYNFSPTIVYLALATYSLVALFEIQRGKVSRKNIFSFKSAAEILYRKGLATKGDPEGWGVLIDILYDNLESLFKMSSTYEVSRSLWYRFWIKFVMPNDKFIPILENIKPKKKKLKESKWKVKLGKAIEHIRREIFMLATQGKVNTFFPSIPYSTSSVSAQSIIELYALDKKLLELSIIYKPDFSLRLLEVSKKFKYKVNEVTESTVQKLLANSESYIYDVLIDSNAPDSPRDNSYRGNRFLNIFFARDTFVSDSNISGAVLQFVGKHLTALHKKDEDPYNLPILDFYDGERYRNPILGGLLLYDWIVRTALINGVNWHMFLMSIEWWEEQIVKNMTFDAAGWEEKKEFPTHYFYFLYEIFDTFTDWFTFVDRSDDIIIKPLEGDKDKNGNALQFIVETLPTFLRHAANSDMPEHHKVYLGNMVWRSFFELKGARRSELHAYGDHLLKELFIELTRYDRPFDDSLFKLLISSFYKFDVVGMHTSGAFTESAVVKSKFKEILVKYIAPRLPLYDIDEFRASVRRHFSDEAYIESDSISIPSYFRYEKILLKDIGLPDLSA